MPVTAAGWRIELRGTDADRRDHRNEAAGFQMIGTSGTVTTVGAAHLGLRRYDRRKVDGMHLSTQAIDEVIGRFGAEFDLHGADGIGDGDLPHVPARLLVADRQREPGIDPEPYERLLGDALARHHGNLTQASQDLCMAKTTLFDKVKKYGLSH